MQVCIVNIAKPLGFFAFWARTGLPRAFSLSFHSLSFSSLSFVALQLKPALCMVWAPPIKSCIFRNIAADGRPSRAKLVRGQARPGMVPTGEHTNADLDLEPVKRSATPTMARSCPHCSACHDGSTAPCVDLNAEPLPRLAATAVEVAAAASHGMSPSRLVSARPGTARLRQARVKSGIARSS